MAYSFANLFYPFLMDQLQIAVPTFDGKRNSFLNYEEKVLIWRNISPLPPDQKASHLLLHMSDAVRKVCLTMGKDVAIMRILRLRFAPDKVDSIFQDIYKFTNFKRTTQDMDTFLLEFEMLRQRAEARFDMGMGFPDEFVSVLCISNASLSKNERQLVVASAGSSLRLGIVREQMRRLFGNIGSAQTGDVLVAQGLDQVSDEDDFEAWVAYRKAKRAKKNSSDGVNRDSVPKHGKGKVKNAEKLPNRGD